MFYTYIPLLMSKLFLYYVKLILFVKANICFYNTKCIKNLPVISLVRVKDVKETKFIVTSAEYETKKLFSFHLKRKWIKRNKKRTWWKIVLYWTGLYKKYTKHDCVKKYCLMMKQSFFYSVSWQIIPVAATTLLGT